jgi:hypothetical protein
MNTDAESAPSALVKRQDRAAGVAREKEGRRLQAEGCSCCENREGPAATAAVIAGAVQDGEAGLQILRQRRSCAVLKKRRDADAAPGSRGAMARPRRTRRPRARKTKAAQ